MGKTEAAMFSPEAYQLLDFGEGRRLEAFGPWVLDRPCPAAEAMPRRDLAAWGRADARFERSSTAGGTWSSTAQLPDRWTIAHPPFTLELKRTEFGHLGVFPEQAANWDWIAAAVRAALRPLSVLNLFAYTGGSTLAAAAAGAEVTHVDAAANVVAWARRNAELSGMVDAAVRWIAEDAMKFVRRELMRGTRYDAVILDPPSYGHGRRGEVWRLSRHLRRLLETCAELTAGRRRFILLTCHTPKLTPDRLRRLLAETMGDRGAQVTADTMALVAGGGQSLPSGVVARWQADTTGDETHLLTAGRPEP